MIKNNKQNNLQKFFQETPDIVFEPHYQSKFLKIFIEDKQGWQRQIIDILFPEYFDGYHKIIIIYQIEYFSKYKIQADYEELRDIINDKEKDELVKEHLFGLIQKIKDLEIPHQKIKNIKDRAYSYFKSQKVKNTLIELAHDWQKQTYESMKKKLEGALKAGEPKDVGHDYMLEVQSRLKRDFRNPVPALRGLDERMGGGLASGELGIVLAPPGGGKSMMLVKFGTTALLHGKKVIYYSLELSEKVIGQRFDASLNQIRLNDVWSYKEVIQETIDGLKQKNSRLIIKEFSTGRAGINQIYSHLEYLASNEDFIPDVVIVDYADLMKPSVIYSDKRHTLTGIYEELRGLAGDLKIPVWTASQTNRTAMEKEEYGLETIGESLGKAATADIVIAVGRPSAMKNESIAKIGILKNRNGQDGFYLDFYFDTSKIFIEIKEIENQNNNYTQNNNTYKKIEKIQQKDMHNMMNILQTQNT